MKINVDEEILYFLKEYGYDFGVIFPSSRLKGLYELLEEGNDFTIVNVTREEEGVGVCAGAYLAGKKPFMLIQSTGLGNSFNAIASLLQTYRIPILILASYRGYYNETIPAQVPLGEALPGMLDSMKIPFLIIDDNLESLEPFSEKMYKKGESHVVLLSPELYNK
jgi:sulfopyruvate decarboxylase subunit beta